MSDNPTIKLSVSFERKVGTGDFGSKTASTFLTVEIPADSDVAAVSEKLSELFGPVKAAVYDELGIEVLVDESGVIREKFNPAVTVKESGGVQAARRELGASGGFDTKGLNVRNESDLTEDVPDFVVDYCEQYGITAIWANNGQYGPYYKEAVPQGEDPKGGYSVKNGKVQTDIIKRPK